jgi:hypothetical protein
MAMRAFSIHTCLFPEMISLIGDRTDTALMALRGNQEQEISAGEVAL